MFLMLALWATSSVFASNDLWLGEVKKNCRQDLMTNTMPSRSPRMPFYSPILNGDRAEDLVENPSSMIRSLVAMEQQRLTARKLSVDPWSDSYWPLYLGAIAHRYGDENFVGYNWETARNYSVKNPVSEAIRKNEINILAPSEKYDILFGLSKGLTVASWAEGERYQRTYGDVETWMGLCHGWAAAAIMLPNPVRKVEVAGPSGNMIFYPSDIKAYGTALWAKGRFNSRFVGGRCNTKEPQNDPMGRPKEQECLDNNPGTWHLAIVNQIGQFDRSFVMDATYDYQVWNQPVYGYEYTYYHPKTGAETRDLKQAMIKRSDWGSDPRRGVRASDAQYLVGVKMTVHYIVENSPSQQENQETNFSEVEYVYDLELNSKYEIVGGEWYSGNHPDFLWVPDRKAFPMTYGDGPNVRINLNRLSEESKKAAAQNALYGLPSGAVVREFFRSSAARGNN